MVHRPSAATATRQQPLQTVQNQQQNKQNQERQDGVISMAEVMEDLRVLEHQQKETEALLTNQKRLKKQKIETLASEEQALASSKYQNGEARAAVEKHRQILGDKTREILALEARRASGSDNLKRVDFKLTSALATGERIRSYRHKIDMTMLNLRNVAEKLDKQKQKSEVDLKNAEMRRDNTRHKENLLVKSIANFRSKANSLAEDVIRVKESIENYKTDRANAQHMEASTKFRVESIVAEIMSDRKRHEEVAKEVSERLAVFKAEEMEVRAKMDKIMSKSAGVENEIIAEQEWARRCQIDEDLTSSRDMLDFSTLLERCENEESRVANDMVSMEERKRNEDQMLEEVDRLKTDELAARERTAEITKRVEEGRAVETKRRAVHSDLLEAVQKDHEEVEKLKHSAEELTAQKECAKKEAADKLARQSELTEAEEEAVAIQIKRTADREKEMEEINAELASARRTLQPKVEQARKEADVAKAASILIQSHREELQKRNAKDGAAIEFADIEAQQAAVQSAAKTEIAEVLAQFPTLSSLLTAEYDAKVDLAHQVDKALTNLRDECNRRIQTARQNRQQRVDELRRKRDLERAERKAEKQRAQELKQKEEAEAKARLQAEEKAAERKAEALKRRKRAEKKRQAALEAAAAEKALLEDEEEDDEYDGLATNVGMKSDDQHIEQSARNNKKDILFGEPSTEKATVDNVTPEKPTRKKSVTFSLDESTYFTQRSDGTSVVSKRKTKRRTFDEEFEDENEDLRARTERKPRSSRRREAESSSRSKSGAFRSISKSAASNTKAHKKSRTSRDPVAKSQDWLFDDVDLDHKTVESGRNPTSKSDGARRRSKSTSRSSSSTADLDKKRRSRSNSADERDAPRSDDVCTRRSGRSDKRTKQTHSNDTCSSKPRKSSEEGRRSSKALSSQPSSRGRSRERSSSKCDRSSSSKDRAERGSRGHGEKSDRSLSHAHSSYKSSVEKDGRRKSSSRASENKPQAAKKMKSAIDKTTKSRINKSDEFDFDFSAPGKETKAMSKSNSNSSRKKVVENNSKDSKEKEASSSQASGISSDERQKKPHSSSSGHRPRRLKRRSNLKAKQQKMNLTQVDDDLDFSFA